MGKVVHYVDMAKFPMTRCGVDIQVKTGALWVPEPEGATCSNCVKLMEGGQMGAPPPASGGQVVMTKEEEEKWALESHLAKMDGIERRLVSVKNDLAALQESAYEDEVADIKQAHDYADLAVGRLLIARASVGYRLRNINEKEGTQCGV
jgi:hypothetical protein